MNTNFLETFAATGMDTSHAYQLARNSFEGSFIEPAARERYIAQLDDTFASFAA
jgi:adenosine deaminase